MPLFTLRDVKFDTVRVCLRLTVTATLTDRRSPAVHVAPVLDKHHRFLRDKFTSTLHISPIQFLYNTMSNEPVISDPSELVKSSVKYVDVDTVRQLLFGQANRKPSSSLYVANGIVLPLISTITTVVIVLLYNKVYNVYCTILEAYIKGIFCKGILSIIWISLQN